MKKRYKKRIPLSKGQRGTYTIITPFLTMRNLSKKSVYNISRNDKTIGFPIKIRKQKRRLYRSEL